MARLVQTWSRGRLNIAPWQAIPAQLDALGLTTVDAMTQVWFVDEKGLCGGAAAVNAALTFVWWARPFTFLYPLPGIRQLQNRLYRWIAANRHRLPGSTPQCRLDNPAQ